MESKSARIAIIGAMAGILAAFLGIGAACVGGSECFRWLTHQTATPELTTTRENLVQSTELTLAAANTSMPISTEFTATPIVSPIPVPTLPPTWIPQPTIFTGSQGSTWVDGWREIPWALYSDNFTLPENGNDLWVLPKGTHNAVSTTSGRYSAVESAEVGVVNGIDYGWCGPTQYTCPPHLLLGRITTEAQFDIDAVMDISYRINITNSGQIPYAVRLQFRFNDQTRTVSQLVDDYLSLASGDGILKLFVAIQEPNMEPATLAINGIGQEIGYTCWDCLAGTSSLGTSSIPGYELQVPRPDQDPDFELDFEILVQPGTVVVVWFG